MSATVFLLALVALAGSASAAAASVRVYVTPAVGHPSTRFVVRFRAPSATGSTATVRSHYELYASARHGSGCTSSVSVAIAPTNLGQHVRVTVAHKRGHNWCLRKFSGRIVKVTSVLCLPTKACPLVLIAPQTIARFSFRVTRASTSGGGGTGGSGGTQTGVPIFAGLVSATYCVPPTPKTPGVLPAQRTINLSWNPATDPATPSSQIVYDVFYSTTSGGENYSSPIETTTPGATSDTVQISGYAAAYFVVRAKDAAGREDDNTVERIAVNDCTNT
jgi:hypothetical protein